MNVELRQVTAGDAKVLSELYQSNRTFLAPWEPEREDLFFTEDHQRQQLVQTEADSRSGRAMLCVILADDRIVGRININNVVRGAFDSAHLGYWVAQEVNGRGVATAAVAGAVRLCFENLGLHRIQAATLTHNVASQRVLGRNGFAYIGTAPQYLRIAGSWQDHHLYQLLNARWGR